jgi:hypothetical protein
LLGAPCHPSLQHRISFPASTCTFEKQKQNRLPQGG